MSEVVVGGLVTAVAVVAWISLILAHLGAHSLPAVAALSLAVVACVAAVTVVAVRRWPGRVGVRVDRAGLLGLAAVAVLSAVMFLPGFHYGVADKDPGGYVAHAMEIARTGDYSFTDPASDPQRVPHVEMASVRARFPGVWIQGTDRVVPQFYHLWPALLATSYDLDGERGLSNTAPLCGVLAVCALALAVRRGVASASAAGDPDDDLEAVPRPLKRFAARPLGALRRRAELAGLVAGAVVGVGMATNMLEVWQAKYPTTEISAQLFFVGTLLALVVAMTTGWRPAAFVAGLLTGVGFLDRADNLILLLLAAALGAALLALRRFDGRAVAFVVGIGIVLPHALWQAYSPHAARHYTLSNNVPTLTKVVTVVAVLYAVGLAVRYLARPVVRWVNRRVLVLGRTQLLLGLIILVAAAALLALGFLRPRLFGADYAYFGGQGRQRTFDEQSLDRLGWFVGKPAFLLALLGLAVVALRRWSAAMWTIAGPLLAVLPVYAWHAKNSTRLMWWTRRFVPTVLPGLLALVGIALGVGLVALAAHHWWPRLVLGLPALVVTSVMVGFYLSTSTPLRHHDETGGSFAITRQVADLAGAKDGVYLWPRETCCLSETTLFPAALWLGRGQLSALMPAQTTRWSSYVRSFERGFPGSPVFVVGHGTDRPTVPGLSLVPAKHVVASIDFWENTETVRPSHAVPVPIDFTVWRVAGT